MNESSAVETYAEIPGEPGVYFCARHKNVKTRLRCGRCEKPICPKCTTYGPTGARCRDCASNKSSHIYQVSAAQYALAIVTALVLGVVSAFIASIAGLFALFYAPVAGTFIAKAVSFVTKNKRGTALAVIAIAGVVLGALGPLAQDLILAAAINRLPNTPPEAMFWSASRPLFLLGYLALAIPSIWYWLKN